MWRVVPPPDLLDKTDSSISPLYLDITGPLLERLRLDNFSLFLIYSRSLCNSTTRFVYWEYRVEREQMKFPAKPKSPCAFNWLYYIIVMSTSHIDPLAGGQPFSGCTADYSNKIIISLKDHTSVTSLSSYNPCVKNSLKTWDTSPTHFACIL